MRSIVQCSCGETAIIAVAEDGMHYSETPGWLFISLERDYEHLAATLTEEEYMALPPSPGWNCGKPGHFQKADTPLRADGTRGATWSVLDGKPAWVIADWLRVGGGI